MEWPCTPDATKTDSEVAWDRGLEDDPGSGDAPRDSVDSRDQSPDQSGASDILQRTTGIPLLHAFLGALTLVLTITISATTATALLGIIKFGQDSKDDIDLLGSDALRGVDQLGTEYASDLTREATLRVSNNVRLTINALLSLGHLAWQHQHVMLRGGVTHGGNLFPSAAERARYPVLNANDSSLMSMFQWYGVVGTSLEGMKTPSYVSFYRMSGRVSWLRKLPDDYFARCASLPLGDTNYSPEVDTHQLHSGGGWDGTSRRVCACGGCGGCGRVRGNWVIQHFVQTGPTGETEIATPGAYDMRNWSTGGLEFTWAYQGLDSWCLLSVKRTIYDARWRAWFWEVMNTYSAPLWLPAQRWSPGLGVGVSLVYDLRVCADDIFGELQDAGHTCRQLRLGHGCDDDVASPLGIRTYGPYSDEAGWPELRRRRCLCSVTPPTLPQCPDGTWSPDGLCAGAACSNGSPLMCMAPENFGTNWRAGVNGGQPPKLLRHFCPSTCGTCNMSDVGCLAGGLPGPGVCGQLYGTISADVSSVDLTELMQAVRVRNTGYAVLLELNRSGGVYSLIAHPNATVTTAAIESGDATDVVVQAMLQHVNVTPPHGSVQNFQSLEFVEPSSGVLYVAGCLKLGPPNPEWLIAVLTPKREFQTVHAQVASAVAKSQERSEDQTNWHVRVLIFVFVGASTGALALSLGVGWILSRAIVKSVEDIAQKMMRTAEMKFGDTADTGERSYLRDIAQMEDAFYRMRGNLEEYSLYLPTWLRGPTTTAPTGPHLQEKESSEDSSTTEPPESISAASGVSPEPFGRLSSTPLSASHTHKRSKRLDVGLRPRVGSFATFRTPLSPDEDHVPSESSILSFVGKVLRCARNHQGNVLALWGLGIKVSWNTHRGNAHHARSASRCAMRCEHRAKTCYVGVATGHCVCGNAGDSELRAACAVGRVTSVADSLAHFAEYVQTRVLIAENTHERVRSHLKGRPVDIFSTFARGAPIVAFELCESVPVTTAYNDGFAMLRQGSYSEAATLLAQHCERYPRDRLALRIQAVAARRALGGSVISSGQEKYSQWLGWTDEAPLSPTVVPNGFVSTACCASSGSDCADSSSRRSTVGWESAAPPAPPGTRVSSQVGLRSAVWEAAARNGSPLRDDACGSRVITLTNGNRWHRSDRELGVGSFGSVFACMGEDGDLCAMKVIPLPKSLRQGPRRNKVLHRLLSEVHMLSKLRGEHIVSYFGSGVSGGALVIIMELMPGGTLSSIVKQFGVLPYVTVARYTTDVVRGVAFLHGKGIVHRDLKPENVLLSLDGQCKLSDFGCSRRVADIRQGGDLVGSPLYMAPEACEGRSEQKSDIWGVGITVLEMVTGKPPYDGHFFPPRFIFQMITGAIHPIIPAGLPASLAELVSWCLQRAPEERPAASRLLLHTFLTNPPTGQFVPEPTCSGSEFRVGDSIRIVHDIEEEEDGEEVIRAGTIGVVTEVPGDEPGSIAEVEVGNICFDAFPGQIEKAECGTLWEKAVQSSSRTLASQAVCSGPAPAASLSLGTCRDNTVPVEQSSVARHALCTPSSRE